MPLDFPTTPAEGDQFVGMFGEIYTWDGEKWTLTTLDDQIDVANDLISANPNNDLVLGTDGLLFVPPPPTVPQTIVALPMFLSQLNEGATSPNIGMAPVFSSMISFFQISAELQSPSPGTAPFTLFAIANNGGGAQTTIGTGAVLGGTIDFNFNNWYGGGSLSTNTVFRLQNNSSFGGLSNMSNIILNLYFIAWTQSPR